MLTEADLARLRLPVGEMTKAEVRAEAAALGLRTADKPESMEVCFITRGGRERFLAERGVMRAGDVVDPAGRVLGHHDGAAAFTIGQRRGLGVAAGERRYVARRRRRQRRGHGRAVRGPAAETRCGSAG